MVFSDDLIVDDVMLSENRMPMYFDKDKDRSMKMFHLISSEKTPKGYIYIERQVNPIQENDFEPKIETVENNWIKNTKKPKKIVYENCLTLPIGMQDTGGLVKGIDYCFMLMCIIYYIPNVKNNLTLYSMFVL